MIRARRARIGDLDRFLAAEYDAPGESPPVPEGPPKVLVQALDSEGGPWRTMSHALWNRGADPSPLIQALEQAAGKEADPVEVFQWGVAYRMRHDSTHAMPGDFDAAVRAWQRALRARPDQYIWRRRLQQYGPLTDKPYPFYGWIREAQSALRDCGEEEEVLDAPLTLSEQSVSVTEAAAKPVEDDPDPSAGIPADTEGLLGVEAALVIDTTGRSRIGRLHVVVRLQSPELATWHGGTDPVVVWVDTPPDWQVHPKGQARTLPEDAVRETLHFELDVERPESAPEGATLRGYVLAPICRTADGTCEYVRKNWTLPLAE